MSTHIKSTPPRPVDLEETAELPQLTAAGAPIDPLSSTDAWKVSSPSDDTVTVESLPALSHPPRARGSRADLEPLERSLREAEIGALRSDLASVSESRSHLERDLQSLSGNLRELEQMLNRKSEQLSVYEREVGLRDRRIAELETRSGELESDLAAQQARLHGEQATQRQQFDVELTSVSSHLAQVRVELVQARAAGEAAQARIDLQAEELLGLRSERSRLLQRAEAAESDLVQWRTRGERYRETLQSLEGRRELYDGVIAEREARIAELEHESAERERHIGAREEALRIAVRNQEQRVGELEAARTRADAAAGSARERITALEAEIRQRDQGLGDLRSSAGAREAELSTALRTEQQRNTDLTAARGAANAAAATARAEYEADAAAARERIAALEAETSQQAESLRELRARSDTREQELSAALRVQQQRTAELEAARAQIEAEAAAAHSQAEANAAAARERIAILEAETRQQAAAAQELRVQLGAVRDSLAQRNAMIERVEAEAASSVAMLGNIQHNLAHMGAEEPAHLLVRSDGDTGIVHLLGKRTTIGRTPDNDMHIDAEFISRHHAVALRAGAKTVIEDLNSTNGTYVNGQRVNRRTLKDGDLVTLGRTEFRYSISKSPVKPPA
ncbi:MAG TPA: FHA domain-containing protein [Steroidobacteraceae bacterium]